MGADMFHADRRRDIQTDMTKLIPAFRKFANAPKKVYVYPQSDGTTYIIDSQNC